MICEPPHGFLNIKCQRNYCKIKEKNNKSSSCELSLSLIFSLWCLIFVFYSKLGLGHGNPALMEFNASSSSDNPGVSSRKLAKSVYSLPETSGLEEVFWKVLGNTALVCKLQQREDKKLQPAQLPFEEGQPAYLKYDEFPNITSQEPSRGMNSDLVNITYRLEPDGSVYNYASDSKGAKVVAHNKDAKGANNILGEDYDKYLRNPCSVEDKFVVIELAEETLVDSVKIANFEHYSSNFKEFELSGTLSYPTEAWSPLGNFLAANVKHAQIFKLPESKWVRYLKLRLVSHYGSEFYCTLSVVEVYGINAIERMLEDLIVSSVGPVPNKSPEHNSSDIPSLKPEAGQIDKKGKEVESENDSVAAEISSNTDTQKLGVEMTRNPVIPNNIPDPVIEFRQQLNGRIAGDTVLKILMQMMRSVELNLSALEEYIKELNKRRGDTELNVEKELSRLSESLEQSKSEIKDLWQWNANMEKGITDFESWKEAISSEVNALVRENSMLRLDVEKIVSDQANLETKELAVLVVSLFFVCLAILQIISAHMLTFFGANKCDKAGHATSRGWVTLFVCCSVTISIILFYS